MNKFNKLFLPAALILLLVLVYAVYQPGLRGGFLFDDYPNLEELGTYGGVTDFETFKNFVFNGVSSPLGRPLALVTFLLDDNTWPTHAPWFKATNLKFHLLTGLFLCLASLHLLRLFGKSDTQAAWIALLSASIWMLHPYMVSTTLYVVQRMAQLAAMFVFMGLAGYLYGRLLLLQNKVLPAYIWMSLSLVCGTGLALLSKENGALLPLLVLTLEFCLPKSLPVLSRRWRTLFLWLPSAGIIFLLAKEINFSPDAWPNRPFTQPERLLTEPRIIWEYLYHLYVPRIEGRGLFQDGYAFSTSLLAPLSTPFALVGLFILIFAAIAMRQRFPFFALSILFYFIAHLLESTLIGLELYFEHRNYLSAAFLFLPLGVFLVEFEAKNKVGVAIVGSFVILTTLTFLTWHRTNLWADTKKLELYWAASTPESPRAQNKIGSLMLSAGKVNESIAFMEKSLERFPDSSLLAINTLLIRVYALQASDADFRRISQLMKTQPFDAQSVMGLRNLVEKLTTPKMSNEYRLAMMALLDEVAQNKVYNRVHTFRKLLPYLKARLYLGMEDYENAYLQFDTAIAMYTETDAALSIVAIMANADRPVEAYLLFKKAEKVFEKQPDKTLKRSRDLYNFEFKRMKYNLDEHLKAVGIGELNLITPNGDVK